MGTRPISLFGCVLPLAANTSYECAQTCIHAVLPSYTELSVFSILQHVHAEMEGDLLIRFQLTLNMVYTCAC